MSSKPIAPVLFGSVMIFVGSMLGFSVAEHALRSSAINASPTSGWRGRVIGGNRSLGILRAHRVHAVLQMHKPLLIRIVCFGAGRLECPGLGRLCSERERAEKVQSQRSLRRDDTPHVFQQHEQVHGVGRGGYEIEF